MSSPQLRLDCTDDTGAVVTIPVDAQTTVSAGERPDTAVIITPDGRQFTVVGDHRDIHVHIQAAAARLHEAGLVEQGNTPVI